MPDSMLGDTHSTERARRSDTMHLPGVLEHSYPDIQRPQLNEFAARIESRAH